jgi:phosphoribosylformimino-5-aminoimidazole carboxamide ribotide isomerase
MIVAPAIDLKGGRCVQLVGGRPEDERVSIPDAVAVAERWWRAGFRTLHLVDLDAALGSGDNLALLREVIRATPAATQVGGGVRDDARADALLEAGAERVVVGTRALDDPAWLASLATRRPERVVVAADTRDGRVLRRGWTERSGVSVGDFLRRLEGLPLAGVLATDVGREGRMEGIDRRVVAHTLRSSPHPVWVSGGVTTEDDLAWLDGEGAAGAVLGMALYTGTLPAERLAERWGSGGERTVDDEKKVGDDT